jgi:CheY-like chemotaxis protein
MGLIHRDVKPANVLIAGRTAFLTDFGLTKRLDGEHTQLTRAGDVVGTIHYVAPEQIEGGQVSTRSDVYSLGCLLYHCLTGQVPYSRETDVAVIYAHLSEPPPKLTALRPELAAGLDGVIAKALDKSPDRRFPTCSDLVNAARGVIDAAGPLDTSAPRGPRESSVLGGESHREVGDAIDGMRDAAAAARRPRVLLGGVDAHTRAVARMALGDRIDVIETGDSATLVERAREERPDLVILDYVGAGMAAGSAVGSLRDDALTRDAKVLLLVDFAHSADREVTAAGADERLAMPFSPLQLQVKLRKLLGAEAVSG